MLIDDKLFALLQVPFSGAAFQCNCSPDEWMAVYSLAFKQHVEGLAFQGVSLLPPSQRPPLDLIFQWASEVEVIRGQNLLLNSIASKLTQMFLAEGLRSVVLKGPANACLYPNKLNRQCGDIDIWVEGGRKSVTETLVRLGLLQISEKQILNKTEHYRNEFIQKLADLSSHHVQLPKPIDGVNVEVHFEPSAGTYNPRANKRLLLWLNREIQMSAKTEDGFYVPSIRFALVMQLSHIQRHFFLEGIGLKQLVDYYVLLKNSSAEDRKKVSEQLRSFGLFRGAGAVMWVLHRVLHLEEDLMLCEPDASRGQMLLKKILEGGNFGIYTQSKKSFFKEWLQKRIEIIKLLRFDFVEALWSELHYYKMFITFIPLRIKSRKLWLKNQLLE